jgi:hypothetical protein
MSTQEEASETTNHPLSSGGWDNRRIFFVLAIGTLIVSAIWHAPQEATYISERTGEIFFTLVLAMSLTYLMRPWRARSQPNAVVWQWFTQRSHLGHGRCLRCDRAVAVSFRGHRAASIRARCRCAQRLLRGDG